MDTNRTPRIAAAIVAVAAAPILLAAARGRSSPMQQLSVPSATTLIVKITGAKQGVFKSEQVAAKTPGEIPGFAFQFELHAPRDPATGMPSGKRQYTPVTFTKEWGAASPQLFQALNTNENLTSVEFQFVRANSLGQQSVYYTIKLTNATVTGLRSYVGGVGAASNGAVDQRALEDVSFTFQRIEVQDSEGKTMSTDDWRSAT